MTEQVQPDSRRQGWIESAVPILQWLPNYRRTWLRADIMAGLAVWAMTVPQALAYAGIAGVPPVYGLYAVPLAMLAYAMFGTSRTLCVGPESAIAIISAVTVGGLVVQDLMEFLALTSLLALIVGVLFLLFGLLRLGWLASFLSRPVLQGFTQGIALTVIVGQIPIVFGTETEYGQLVNELSEAWHTGFFLKAWAVLVTLGQANPYTTVVGLGSLALLFALRHFLPSAPSALAAVLLSVLAVSLLGLSDHSVKVIGEVGTGMVALSIPAVTMGKVVALLPGALAIVLLGYSVSLSVAAVGAEATGEEINPNQELLALGVANVGAAVSSGFVVSGSLSRGVVIRRAGGQTQVISLVNTVLVIMTLLFVLPLFYRLPYATLSAIVIQAMAGLLSLAYFQRLFRLDRGEFLYGMAALLGVLVLGILEGVALGVVLALGVLIGRVSRPTTAVLGRLPGSQVYRDVTANPKAETFPGLLIFRFDAPIIFPNASHFAETLRRRIVQADPPVCRVLVEAQQINQMDSTGADQLGKVQTEMRGRGITLCFAEVKSALREVINRTGLEGKIGANHFYESIEDGVQAFLRHQEQSRDEHHE